MFSIPPATTILASPSATACEAMMTVWILDPQTLLTVTAPTDCGMPAPIDACLAGAWPRPALSTQPIYTTSTDAGDKLIRCNAAAIDRLPSWVADTDLNRPLKLP